MTDNFEWFTDMASQLPFELTHYKIGFYLHNQLFCLLAQFLHLQTHIVDDFNTRNKCLTAKLLKQGLSDRSNAVVLMWSLLAVLVSEFR